MTDTINIPPVPVRPPTRDPSSLPKESPSVAADAQKTRSASEPLTVSHPRVEATETLEPVEPLHDAVTKLNTQLQRIQRELQFSVDEDSGRMVIKVMDTETDKLIRQIPPEFVLDLARNLDEDETIKIFSAEA